MLIGSEVEQSDPFTPDYSQGLPTLGLGQATDATAAPATMRYPNVPILIGGAVLIISSTILFYVAASKNSVAGVVTADILGTLGMVAVPVAFITGN